LTAAQRLREYASAEAAEDSSQLSQSAQAHTQTRHEAHGAPGRKIGNLPSFLALRGSASGN